MTRVQRGGIILVVLVGLLAAFFLFHDRLAPPEPSREPVPGGPAVVRAPARQPEPAPAPAAPEPAAPARPAALVLTPAEVRDAPPARGGVLAGRVVSFSSGEGISSAELTFASAAGTWSVVSGASGAFTFAPPRPGTYDLVSALADGYLPFAPAWGHTPIRFQARAGKRIEGALVTLVPAIRYTGVVVAADQRPVEGAEVHLIFLHTENSSLAPIQDQYRSGPGGEFTFSAPDDTLLRASHPDHAPAWGRVDFKVQVSKRLVLTLGPGTDVPAQSIAGWVRDAAGAPVSGAQVIAWLSGADPFESLQDRAHAAVSGPDGAFELTHLAHQAHDLAARLRGYAPAEKKGVAAGSRDVVLEFGPSHQGRIVGTVRARATGAPVPAFTVLVSRPTGPMTEGRLTHLAVFDPEGRYAVDGLEAGTCRVRAVAFGFAPAAPVDVILPDPPTKDARADLELPQGGRLKGTVIDSPSREPLAKARVTTEGTLGAGAAVLPVSATATTDDQGRFDLAGLPSGQQSVTAAAAGHNARIVSGLHVEEGRVLGPVEIALTPLKEGEEPGLEFVGIGAVLGAEGEALLIGRVIEGGGAAEAGLGAGDAILAVDGRPVTELGFTGAIQAIRGPEATTVVLSVRKAGGDEIELPVIRRRLKSR